VGDDEEIEEEVPAEGEEEKKKHRKKRRHREPRQLDEDDLELINENFPRLNENKKRKRLLKVSERDKGVDGDDDAAAQVKGEAYSEEDEEAQVFQ
jgi:hypothetical protein